MTTKLKISCPGCGRGLRIHQHKLESDLRCPACGAAFTPSQQLLLPPLEDSTESNPQQTMLGGDTTNSPNTPPKPQESRLGRFQIQRKLGQGGFGAVYEAFDPQLQRSVAIKVPTFGPGDKRRSRRFVTEARSAARLHHPHIVAVYENGQTDDGRLFIASEFIDGRTLRQLIENGESSIADFAGWVHDIADALTYAHSEGVVHRDIKPENVLIDFEHQRARIADFGLAKVTDKHTMDQDAPLQTQDGVLGTPAFMAPEQARGEISKVGAHSDQYSLGAVLYQCLTGKPPFSGSTYVIIAAVAGQEEPPAIATVNSQAPRDLIAICEKAMHKEISGRYENLAALRDDLGRWRDGETVTARPTSVVVKFARWCRRNPGIASLTTLLATVILTATSLLYVAFSKAEAEKEIALAAKAEAVTEGLKTQRALDEVNEAKSLLEQSYTNLEAARKEAEDNARIAEANETTANQEKDKAEKALAKLEAQIEKTKTATEKMMTAEAGQEVLQLSNELQRAYNDFYKGQELLTREPARGLLWLARALRRIEQQPKPTAQMQTFARLVRSTMAPEIATLGKITQTFNVGTGLDNAQKIAFSPDLSQVATVSGSTLDVHDTQTGTKLYAASLHPGIAGQNQKYSAVSGQAGDICCNQICFFDDHSALAVLSGELRQFSQSGFTVRNPLEPMFTAFNANVRLHNFRSDLKKPIVTTMPYSPNGAMTWHASTLNGRELIFTARFRREPDVETSQIMSWNGNGNAIPTQGPKIDLPTPVVAVRTLRRLNKLLVATGSTFRVYPLTAGASAVANVEIIPCQDRVTNLFVSPDETRVAAILPGGRVMLFETGEYVSSILNHNGKTVNSAVFSADGRYLTTGCDDRLLRTWECDTGALRSLPLLHPGRILSVTASADQILSVCSDGKLRRWQLAQPAQNAVMKMTSPAHALVSPDGRYVLLCSQGDRQSGAAVGLFDPTSGVEVHSVNAAALNSSGSIVDAQYANAADCIVVAKQRKIHLLSAQNLNPIKPPLIPVSNPGPDTEIAAVATSDDAVRMVLLYSDGQAYIRRGDMTRPLKKLPLVGVTSIAISGDGHMVAAGNDQGEVHVINAVSAEFTADSKLSDGAVSHLQFSPSGRQLAVTTFPAGLQLLNSQTLAVERVCEYPPEEEVQKIDFHADGSSVSVVCNVAVRSWELKTGLQTMFRVRSGTDIPADISPDGQFFVDGNTVKTTQLSAEGTAEQIRFAIERSAGIRLTEDGVVQFIDTTN